MLLSMKAYRHHNHHSNSNNNLVAVDYFNFGRLTEQVIPQQQKQQQLNNIDNNRVSLNKEQLIN